MNAAHRHTDIGPHTISTSASFASRTQRDSQPASAFEVLSDRQAVIAVMAASGRTNRQIALRLRIPIQAVEQYLNEALDILRLTSQQDLTHAAITAHSRNAAGDALNAEAEQGLQRQTSQNHEDNLDQGASREREEVVTFELLKKERETVENLEKAVHSRDVIGQAKGILMERYKISADAAFAILQNESSHTGQKIVDLAAQLSYTGSQKDQ